MIDRVHALTRPPRAPLAMQYPHANKYSGIYGNGQCFLFRLDPNPVTCRWQSGAANRKGMVKQHSQKVRWSENKQNQRFSLFYFIFCVCFIHACLLYQGSFARFASEMRQYNNYTRARCRI